MSVGRAIAPLCGLAALALTGAAMMLMGGGATRAIKSDAEVGSAWVRDAAGDTPCEPAGGAFVCGPHSWHKVEAREVIVRGKGERCLWVHPQQGRTVLLTMATPVSEAPLKVSVALDDRAVGDGAPVDVELWRGSGHATYSHPDLRGWRGVVAPGEPGELLTLGISSAHEGKRHFCFRLEGAATLPAR
jgi:hypothetical protein